MPVILLPLPGSFLVRPRLRSAVSGSPPVSASMRQDFLCPVRVDCLARPSVSPRLSRCYSPSRAHPPFRPPYGRTFLVLSVWIASPDLRSRLGYLGAIPRSGSPPVSASIRQDFRRPAVWIAWLGRSVLFRLSWCSPLSGPLYYGARPSSVLPVIFLPLPGLLWSGLGIYCRPGLPPVSASCPAY